MAFTNIGLIDNCEKALNTKTLYGWGTYGSVATDVLINAKSKQYPSRYSLTRKTYLYGQCDGVTRLCDCCGLVKNYFFGGWDKFKYSSEWDKNVSMWKTACGKTYKIDTLPETKGVALFKSGHMGVYAGNGYVYECTLSNDWKKDGVIKSRLNDTDWVEWGYLPIEYVKDNETIRNTIREKLKEIASLIDEL